MTTSSKFSIIVPVYNVEEYLEQCLNSILHQTYQNFEIILIDDGSTDNSPGICEIFKSQFEDKIMMIHQANKGLSGARNTGLNHATGDYILFIDSDDYIKPTMLEEIESKTKLNPDMIAFQHAVDGKDDEKKHHLDITENTELTGQDFLLQCINQNGMFMMVWKYAYKHSFVERNYFRFHEGIIHEDEEWTVKALCKAHTLIFINQAFYIYRKREGSIMKTKNENSIIGYITVAGELSRFFHDISLNNDLRTKLKHRIFDFYYYNALKMPNREIVRENIRVLYDFTNVKEIMKGLYLRIFLITDSMWEKHGKEKGKMWLK